MQFPSSDGFSSQEPSLSVVIPAFNEQLRLPRFLEQVRAWLDQRYPARYQVIVVDDGSSDGLPPYLESLWTWPEFSFYRHDRNRGKGAALRTGIQAASNELLLLADADGATPIEEADKLLGACSEGADLAVGSRFSNRAHRPWYRALSGHVFAGLVRTIFGLSIHDTQCGFKLLRRHVAQYIAGTCTETGYLFELELLVAAERAGYKISEVPVRWNEIPGSKVRLFSDGIKMALGVTKMWLGWGPVYTACDSQLLYATQSKRF